jgi:hypothetical protein
MPRWNQRQLASALWSPYTFVIVEIRRDNARDLAGAHPE